jgi:hypothetical protein
VNELHLAEGYERPLFALFAYDATANPETTGRNLADVDPAERPDVTCVLDPGLLAARNDLLDPTSSSESFVYGATLLHDPTDGHRPGRYVAAATDGPQSRQQHNGVVYPVVDYQETATLADPSRALLLFCETLIRLLAARDGRAVPVLSHYLPPAYRSIERAE